MQIPTTLQLTLLDIAKLIPIAINVVILMFWIKSKVRLDDFLVGRSVGTLRCELMSVL